MECYPKRLVENLNKIIFDIDAELGGAPNLEYRQHLLKVIYALRDLDLFVILRLQNSLPRIQTEETNMYLNNRLNLN
jgi:hypothetical protein